jgi:hypothetical protein
MISPPCTLPHGFASLGSIVFEKTVFDAETGFADRSAIARSVAAGPLPA